MSTEIVEIKGVKFDPNGLEWLTASSGNTDNCVEVAFADGGVVVRDSKDPDGGRLVYTDAEWTTFLGGVMAGMFNR